MASITPTAPKLSIHEQGNRIFFCSQPAGRAPINISRGIKKANFLERLFGKATKLSFDGGRTTTAVNTNSLQKYLLRSTGFRDHLSRCGPDLRQYSTVSKEIVLQGADDSSLLKKSQNIFFGVFKQNALRQTTEPSQAPSKLGDFLKTFVEDAYHFRTTLKEGKQSQYLHEKTAGNEKHKHELTKLCKAILNFPQHQEKVRVRKLDKLRAKHLEAEVITPLERTDTPKKVSTTTKVGGLVTSMGIGAAVGGPVGAAVGGLAYGAATGIYGAVQWLNAEA